MLLLAGPTLDVIPVLDVIPAQAGTPAAAPAGNLAARLRRR
jgi:hypothetical protein